MPSAVIVVPAVIVPLEVNSMPTAIVPLVTSVTVSTVVLMEPVNTAIEFQVCERSSTGALAVRVPLLAASVVKVPAAGVVLPMAGGAAKLMRALSRVPLVIASAAWVWVSMPRSDHPDAVPSDTKVKDCPTVVSVASVT